MFGLSWRERIDELLIRAYKDDMPEYKMDLRAALDSIEKDDVPIEEENIHFRRITTMLYSMSMGRITEKMFAMIDAAPTDVQTRKALSMVNPQVTGVESIDYIDNFDGLFPKDLFCFMYYAFSGRPGKKKDAERHSDLYWSIKSKASSEIFKEYDKENT